MPRHEIELVMDIGVNWCGKMEWAKELIGLAKRSGADVAKFQIYDPERLLDRSNPVIEEHWDTIAATELSLDQVKELRAECDEVGIEFLASVFHPDRVPWCEEIGMERYKIASRSMYDGGLAEAIAATAKPVIVSWGHYDKEKGWPAVWGRSFSPKPKISNLYCISKYPAPLGDLDFFESDQPTKLEWSIFVGGYFHGFSDHTVGIGAAVMAMSLGAKMIEKHFTLNRYLPGPDQVCSIVPMELTQLCRIRDQIEEILYTADQV